jgi:hypothetical protein
VEASRTADCISVWSWCACLESGESVDGLRPLGLIAEGMERTNLRWTTCLA